MQLLMQTLHRGAIFRPQLMSPCYCLKPRRLCLVRTSVFFQTEQLLTSQNALSTSRLLVSSDCKRLLTKAWQAMEAPPNDTAKLHCTGPKDTCRPVRK